MIVRLYAEAGTLHAILALNNMILVGHVLRLVRRWHEILLLLMNMIISARGTFGRKVTVLKRADE